jgi:AcrR family transcriptional regulator
MKTKEKVEAIRLRRAGNSVRDIADKVGVSKGTVSIWVRDIELTTTQLRSLILRNPAINGQMSGAKARREKALIERMEHQREGRRMAKDTHESDFVAGCVMYWTEGSKGRNVVEFTNTDKVMMRFFIGYLRRYFDVSDSEVSISLKFYNGNGISLDDALSVWLNELQLKKESIRKSQVDVIRTDGYGQKKGKKPYGVCRIRVCRTDIVQKIFGAIQEIFHFENSEWVV